MKPEEGLDWKIKKFESLTKGVWSQLNFHKNSDQNCFLTKWMNLSHAKIFTSALMIYEHLENLTSHDDTIWPVCDCGLNTKIKAKTFSSKLSDEYLFEK